MKELVKKIEDRLRDYEFKFEGKAVLTYCENSTIYIGIQFQPYSMYNGVNSEVKDYIDFDGGRVILSLILPEGQKISLHKISLILGEVSDYISVLLPINRDIDRFCDETAENFSKITLSSSNEKVLKDIEKSLKYIEYLSATSGNGRIDISFQRERVRVISPKVKYDFKGRTSVAISD